MAKPRGTAQKVSQTVDAVVADEALPLQEIRKFYDLGRRALDAFPKGAKQDSKTIERLGQEEKIHSQWVRLARAFARHYTKNDLEALCRLRSPGGRPLSFAHVRFLLTVPDKARRAELARQAAREGWSSRDLEAIVKAERGGPVSHGGRRCRQPKDPRAALILLVELGEKLLRYWRDVEGRKVLPPPEGSFQGEAVAGVRDMAGKAVAKLAEVEKAARRVAKQLRPVADAEGERAEDSAPQQAEPGKAVAPPKESRRRRS